MSSGTTSIRVSAGANDCDLLKIHSGQLEEVSPVNGAPISLVNLVIKFFLNLCHHWQRKINLKQRPSKKPAQLKLEHYGQVSLLTGRMALAYAAR